MVQCVFQFPLFSDVFSYLWFCRCPSKGVTIMRYINLHFTTYLLSYYCSDGPRCGKMPRRARQSAFSEGGVPKRARLCSARALLNPTLRQNTQMTVTIISSAL